MPNLESVPKKPVNLSLSPALVQESCANCCKLSAKVEEMLQNDVLTERQSRQQHHEQAQQAVASWARAWAVWSVSCRAGSSAAKWASSLAFLAAAFLLAFDASRCLGV